MSREFKKTFFTSLIAVLLIISNLIGAKLTNFLDLTISVDFLTYPFTFLCTLLLLNYGGKKSAYQGILVAALIQIFVTITYTLAVSLGTQTVMPDLSLYVNEVFKVNELNLLTSLLAFLASHYILIYIYENFKLFKKELFGIVIGLLGAMFLNAFIYAIIYLISSNYDALVIINMLLSNVLVSLVLLVLIAVLYYLLKEKTCEVVNISNMNIKVNNNYDEAKSIEEVITSKKEVKKSSPKPKKVKQEKKYTKTKTQDTTKKKVKKEASKQTVNKKNTKKSQPKVNKTSK